MPWPRLEVLIRQLPRSSNYIREVSPEWADWGITNQQLAQVVDLLQWANWQRPGDPRAPHPSPSWRPEFVPEIRAKQARKQTMAERLVAQAQRVIEARRKT